MGREGWEGRGGVRGWGNRRTAQKTADPSKHARHLPTMKLAPTKENPINVSDEDVPQTKTLDTSKAID